jgi:hypothetical protein
MELITWLLLTSYAVRPARYNACAYRRALTHTRTHVFVHICIYIYLCVFVCVYINICMEYTHSPHVYVCDLFLSMCLVTGAVEQWNSRLCRHHLLTSRGSHPPLSPLLPPTPYFSLPLPPCLPTPSIFLPLPSRSHPPLPLYFKPLLTVFVCRLCNH